VDVHYPSAERIVLVLAALYAAFLASRIIASITLARRGSSMLQYRKTPPPVNS
jgi:hypothetical protein